MEWFENSAHHLLNDYFDGFSGSGVLSVTGFVGLKSIDEKPDDDAVDHVMATTVEGVVPPEVIESSLCKAAES
jgi:hypothetical protein